MKSYLTGEPTLELTLSQDTLFEDYNFHECVDHSNFNFSRKLKIVPPKGEFNLMNF